jgi:hypothetical protein
MLVLLACAVDAPAPSPDACDAPAFFRDADGDGFGSPVGGACASFDGAVADASDCDDTRSDVFPGAADTCGDATDGDCNPNLPLCDDVDYDVTGVPAWTGEQEAGLAGAAVAFVEDVDGDGTPAVAIGAVLDRGVFLREGIPAETAPLVAEDLLAAVSGWGVGTPLAAFDEPGGTGLVVGDADGRLHVVAGPLTSAPAARAVLEDWTPSDSMAPIAVLGDTDGDGDDELAYGDADFGVGLVSVASEGAILAPARVLRTDGGDVVPASAGDTDGDGLDDLLAGSRAHAAVWLFRGDAPELTVADADAAYLGEGDDGTGAAIGPAGDVDGDGLDDVLLTSREDVDGSLAATALFFSGARTGTFVVSSADARIAAFGEDAFAPVRAGDIDDDGVVDVLLANVSLQASDGRGGVWVAYGPPAGTTYAADVADRLVPEGAGEGFGVALDVGDVDADGFLEVIVGAPLNGDVGGGAVYVFSGGAL